MSFRLTFENVQRARDEIRRKRFELMAQREQIKREEDALFALESDMTKVLDTMQLQSRMHSGTEARQ